MHFFRNKLFLVIIAITAIVYTCVQCGNVSEDKKTVSDDIKFSSQYVGSSACVNCHKGIYESHINTAHFNTTAVASEKNIHGSFDSGYNFYSFGKRGQVKSEKIDGKLYQVAYIDGVEKMKQEFDIIFGYGKKAQSFASWSGNKLVQLPLSHFSATKQWINSPGYPDKIIFNRVITSRCMECHSTFAQVTAQNGVFEDFERSTMILGIDCEKCHGRASEHISFKTQNPNIEDKKYITNSSDFTRQQKLDLCALCHSGNMNNLQPSFSFKPGDKLADYYSYNIIATDAESLDVHGNQYGLLSMSKCFVQSEMTCNSCHDSHKKETGQTALFSQRCMNCHTPKDKNFCTISEIDKVLLEKNCIDCHMPEKKSNAIVFFEHSTQKNMAAKMRSHLIKIYPEEVEKMKSFIKKMN